MVSRVLGSQNERSTVRVPFDYQTLPTKPHSNLPQTSRCRVVTPLRFSVDARDVNCGYQLIYKACESAPSHPHNAVDIRNSYRVAASTGGIYCAFNFHCSWRIPNPSIYQVLQ